MTLLASRDSCICHGETGATGLLQAAARGGCIHTFVDGGGSHADGHDAENHLRNAGVRLVLYVFVFNGGQGAFGGGGRARRTERKFTMRTIHLAHGRSSRFSAYSVCCLSAASSYSLLAYMTTGGRGGGERGRGERKKGIEDLGLHKNIATLTQERDLSMRTFTTMRTLDLFGF